MFLTAITTHCVPVPNADIAQMNFWLSKIPCDPTVRSQGILYIDDDSDDDDDDDDAADDDDEEADDDDDGDDEADDDDDDDDVGGTSSFPSASYDRRAVPSKSPSFRMAASCRWLLFLSQCSASEHPSPSTKDVTKS